jgi:hypothetical protein
MKITKGKQTRAQRVVLYGVETHSWAALAVAVFAANKK